MCNRRLHNAQHRTVCPHRSALTGRFVRANIYDISSPQAVLFDFSHVCSLGATELDRANGLLSRLIVFVSAKGNGKLFVSRVVKLGDLEEDDRAGKQILLVLYFA